MGVKEKLVQFAIRRRFAKLGAHFEIGIESKVGSGALFPKKNSRLTIGSKSIFHGRVAMDLDGAQIRVGDRTFVGNGLLVCAKSIDIGSDVLISWNVTIVDHQSHHVEFEKRANDVTDWLHGNKDWTHVQIDPVRICDKVWIGFGANVLPGVTVGEGAVIGACSVVTHDVEPFTVVAGNPAKVVRRLVAEADSKGSTMR
ncbi:MAG: acyltransferase [Hyphomicrobiaceae bacterium]